MATIPTHRLSIKNGVLQEMPAKTNIIVVKGTNPLDASDAIISLEQGHDIFWDPQYIDGLKFIRKHFQPAR